MEQQEQKQQERDFRIRKLSPRECFRLMDVCEDDIDKIQATGISKSQQYKLAGNSIVVSCLVEIFRQMFRPTHYTDGEEAKPKKKPTPKPQPQQTTARQQPQQLSFFDF